MPLFGRPPNPPPVPSAEMPPGEEVERGTKAVLLLGREAMKGTLYMTNRRLLFEAQEGGGRARGWPRPAARRAPAAGGSRSPPPTGCSSPPSGNGYGYGLASDLIV